MMACSQELTGGAYPEVGTELRAMDRLIGHGGRG